jgi:hypothetical protein
MSGLVNDDQLKRIWKKMIVAYLISIRNLPEVTGMHEILQAE